MAGFGWRRPVVSPADVVALIRLAQSTYGSVVEVVRSRRVRSSFWLGHVRACRAAHGTAERGAVAMKFPVVGAPPDRRMLGTVAGETTQKVGWGKCVPSSQSRQHREEPRSSRWEGGCSACSERRVWGCGHCPHFGLRIGSYWGRIGPDSACFRGSPVFARAGMQFESHLGHSVSAVQSPFCVSSCGQCPHSCL